MPYHLAELIMDIDKIRSEFPILARKLYNRPLVYLDNTATSQTLSLIHI